MAKRKLKLFTAAIACLAQPILSTGQGSSTQLLVEAARSLKSSFDFNDDIYYRNKLEYSQELGVLPFNIPFVFDFLVGDDYSQKPLHYTLVPIFPSLRWHMGKLNGPSILRGNTDLTVTLSFTAIPRGPVTGGPHPTLRSAPEPGSLMRRAHMACSTARGRISLSLL
jgi:hypothetical protein